MAAQNLEEILESAESVEVEPALSDLIDSFIKGIHESYEGGYLEERDVPFNVAIAALFDLCVNALYARKAVGSEWVYCADKATTLADQHFRGDYLYYPFVGACPRCVVKGNFEQARAHKPPSNTIGSINATVISAIYEMVAEKASGKARVLQVPGRGDADLVFVEDHNVCVAEIKASPLVSYPLAVVTEPIEGTNADTGDSLLLDHHGSTATHLNRESIYLYIPHDGEYVDLGARNGDSWPLDTLAEYVSSPEGASRIAFAWSRLFQIYSDKSLRNSDYAWYSVNGCGEAPNKFGGFRISDGKNMPGIDRTDDLKKGTYQVLKMGAAHKERVDMNVRAALVANIHAVIHDEVYVEDLANIVWTKDGPDDDFVIKREDEQWTVDRRGIFNLYDGIICITHSRFRDTWLKTIADVNSLKYAGS